MKSNNTSKSYSALAVILTIALFVLVWKLIVPGYTANKAAIAQAEQEINQASAKKDALDQARSEISSVESAYKQITVAISDDTDEANVMSEIEAIGIKNGLTVPSINISGAGDEAESDNAATDEAAAAAGSSTASGGKSQIDISVIGSFDQLSAFVTGLENSVKFINIKSISYSQGENGALNLNLTLEAYNRVTASAASVEAAQ